MKRTTIVIDEKLIRAGLKATGLKSCRALVDYALRDLLGHESPPNFRVKREGAETTRRV